MDRNKRFVMEMQIIVVNQQKEQKYEVTENSKTETKLDIQANSKNCSSSQDFTELKIQGLEF